MDAMEDSTRDVPNTPFVAVHCGIANITEYLRFAHVAATIRTFSIGKPRDLHKNSRLEFRLIQFVTSDTESRERQHRKNALIPQPTAIYKPVWPIK
jgi:hypothetical protein